MNMDFVSQGIVAILIGGTMAEPSTNTTTSHPPSKGVRVVVSAVLSLGGGRPAKFTSPDDQRILQQASGFEILQKACNRLVDLCSQALVILFKLTVLIPVSVTALNKPNTSFRESGCQ